MKTDSPLLNRLIENSDNYSKSQRKLAKYILADYQKVAFSTIKDLAATSGASEATIVRFAKTLGFKGYPDFQKEIRRIIRADLKGHERFKIGSEFQKDNHLISKIIKKEMENLYYLEEAYDEELVRQAVAAINGAEEVLVVGTRSTASLANHFFFGLSKVDVRVFRATALTTELYDHINKLGENCLLIAIGFPRYVNELIEVLKFSRKRGLKTISITDSPFSPLRGDINFYVPTESTSFIAFHCAPLVLINAIVIELSHLDRKRTIEALNRFEVLAEEREYFDNS